jgi:hypothetical protein
MSDYISDLEAELIRAGRVRHRRQRLPSAGGVVASGEIPAAARGLVSKLAASGPPASADRRRPGCSRSVDPHVPV